MDDSYIDIGKYIKNNAIYNNEYMNEYIDDNFDLYYKNIRKNNEVKKYEQFYANYDFTNDKYK